MLHNSSIISDIERRLSDFRKKQNTLNLFSQASLFIAILLLSLALVVVLESLFRFGSTPRTFLVLGLLSLTTGFFLFFIVIPVLRLVGLLRSIDDSTIAHRIGEYFPSIKDRLFNLLQLRLESSKGNTFYSEDLLDAAFQDLADNIRNLDFSDAVDRTRLQKSRRILLSCSIAVLSIGLFFPHTMFDSFHRLSNYDREFVVPTRFVFTIHPGNVEIVKGEDVEITVDVSTNDLFEQSRDNLKPILVWQSIGQSAHDKADFQQQSNGGFKARLGNVRASIDYHVELERVSSDLYRLTVIDRPIIRSLQVRLDYPRYTKLPARIQENFIGDVTALAGTRISIEGIASKELSKGQLSFADGTYHALNVRFDKFSTSFLLEKESLYTIDISDRDGLSNINPITYHLKIIPDEYPTVSILYPGRNIEIAGDRSFLLALSARDDFGISRLRIGHKLVHSRYEPPSKSYSFVEIPLPANESSDLETRYEWNISALSLVPEDVIEYFAEVFDNDLVSGPKSSKSQTYIVRLPSLEEVFADLDKGHEQTFTDINKSLEEAKELKEKISSISDDMKKNKEIDWQQQKRVEELSKRYQQLQKKLDEVKGKLDEMVQQMQKQNVLSNETLEKYLELQQLFDQLNSEELQKALRQMQMAMQNLNREQLQQALQQLTFSEERFRASIERTLNLLKRIQIEQKLDELKKRAEELSTLQEQINHETSTAEQTGKTHDHLTERQQDLQHKQKELEARASEVERRMEEFFTEMPVDRLAQLNRELQQQGLQERMGKAAENMRTGNLRQAQGLQQQIQQSLQQYAKELNSLQEEMLRQHSQHTINELRRAISNLLELSRRQESLKDQSQHAPQNSPQLRQNAQDQMRVIQDLQHVIAALGDLSQRSFAVTPEIGKAIGESLAQMHNALRSLELRSGQMASHDQQEAMGSLNRAAMQVQRSLQAIMQAGEGGLANLLQQLQAMAGQQMLINLQTQQLGQGLSEQIMAKAARLAVEQETVRKSLEQLQQEARASGEQERILGDLNRIAEDMKEIVRNLEQTNVNPETIQKQDRILSRLLDAARSMRERDFEKRRRAQPGTPITRRSPDELDPTMLEGGNRLYEDLLKALELGYAKDYQELIRKYFEELRKIREKD